MAVDVKIKNIPPKLYKKLEARAAAHRNSINCEVIRCLDEVLNPQRVKKMLARIEDLHSRVSDAPPLTDEFLRKAKEEGRP